MPHVNDLFNMFHDPNQQQLDPLLYPEEPSMFVVEQIYNGHQNMNMDVPFSFGNVDGMPTATGFTTETMSAEASHYPHHSPEHQAAHSSYSTASGPSANSSTMGSPHSMHNYGTLPEWSMNGMGANPAIMNYDNNFTTGGEYNGFQSPPGMDDFAASEYLATKPSYVDPSILHPQFNTMRPTSATQSHDSVYQPPPPTFTGSPHSSHVSRSPRTMNHGSQSPYINNGYPAYTHSQMGRRPSIGSQRSYGSQDGNFSSEESKEKGRCPHQECGKVFKDLKAHMLTHQNERPEKCPIQTCDYHIKGFARKYDKNRHTLTHYKGTMVCGFCPGSGSAAEKSFNRADVFKRHLTSVHSVEQAPPNSRKKTSDPANESKKLSAGYAADATGKCSTCTRVFSNAQEFYEHLDDCVLRIVQQEEPSEAINAARLAEVEQDHDVHETLRNNALPTTTTNTYSAGEEDEEDDDEDDEDFTLRSRSSRKNRTNKNPANGVQKSRGLTHSKGGVTLNSKKGKKRKDYPASWGCSPGQMKMKKRVLCVFDGGRRLWKDDMMVDSDYEVRLSLKDEKSYVTDLDVQTMRRADAFLNADESEKGPWISDDLTGVDLEKLMEIKTEN